MSDLSDSGVHTSIRYGTSAGKCNLTSAPNYTDAGYYPVYYEISYKYQGETMTVRVNRVGLTVICLAVVGIAVFRALSN